MTITKGKAVQTQDGLRCMSDYKGRNCNKLICKRNAKGQIAGNYRCERCSQEIEVTS